MKRPTLGFQRVIFVLLAIWFLLLAASFFLSRPIALIYLLPELLLLALIILAAYSIGSFVTEQLRLEEALPSEDFVLATAIGLGGLALLTSIAALLGVLTWWTVGLGLIAAIAAGFYRIIGLVTPPTYLFGPEDLSDEGPAPISWLQYIVIAIWVIALAHFCFLPPVGDESLATTLGTPSQWALGSGIDAPAELAPAAAALTEGLFAMALALRGPHLAMLLSGLLGGLTAGTLYLCAKRYCGPVAARSTLLIGISLPLFCFGTLAPSDGLAMALFQFCAFYCMLRWFDGGRKRWSAMAGVFIGLSLAVSPTAVFFLPPLIASTLIWALIRRRGPGYLLNLAIALAAAAVALAPWLAFAAYVSGSPLTWLQPLAELVRPPIAEGLLQIATLPLSISFPGPAYPAWEVIGPIFLVFIPFYFITYRKNPASGLATALGLSFLGFGEPFGLGLELRLAALMALAIPTAMAAHRFVETAWRKRLAVTMLYIMIGWQIFHSTAMVETIFPGPHRFLLGLESSDKFLARAVAYYPAARYINDELPAEAHLLALGHRGLLYIERRTSVADVETRQRVERLLLDGPEEGALAALRREGYTHLLIDTGAAPRSGGIPSPLAELARMLAERDRLLFRDGEIAVYTLLQRGGGGGQGGPTP